MPIEHSFSRTQVERNIEKVIGLVGQNLDFLLEQQNIGRSLELNNYQVTIRKLPEDFPIALKGLKPTPVPCISITIEAKGRIFNQSILPYNPLENAFLRFHTTTNTRSR